MRADEIRRLKADILAELGRSLLDLARRDKPRAGRPRSAELDEAMRLEAEGLNRKEIYTRLSKTDWRSQHALREAMRQRRRRARLSRPAVAEPNSHS